MWRLCVCGRRRWSVSDIRDRVIDVRRVRMGELIPNPKNWKDHTKAQREALDAVVRGWGWRRCWMLAQLDRMGVICE